MSGRASLAVASCTETHFVFGQVKRSLHEAARMLADAVAAHATATGGGDGGADELLAQAAGLYAEVCVDSMSARQSGALRGASLGHQSLV